MSMTSTSLNARQAARRVRPTVRRPRSGRSSTPRVRSHERRQSRLAVAAGVLGAAIVSVPIVGAINRAAEQDIRSVPGAVWISGEREGRVVMAAASASRAGVGVSVGERGAQLDVADITSDVFVFNRSEETVTRVDPIAGTVDPQKLFVMQAVGDSAQMVSAGNTAYAIDVARQLVRVLTNAASPITVEVEPFDQWAATVDGRLWLLETASGNLTVVDGELSSSRRVTESAADPVLSAVGTEAVIVERATKRLRWVSRATSESLALSGDVHVVQEPSLVGSCITIVSAESAVCQGPQGVVKRMPGLQVSSAAQLFADGDSAVVAEPAVSMLIVLQESGNWVTHPIEGISGRRFRGFSLPQRILVDDPGSRWAWTVEPATVKQLDKLSSQAMWLEGGTADDEAGLSPGPGGDGAILQGSVDRPVDNNGQNDPPIAVDDREAIRAGRSLNVFVLSNDLDPENDPLAISSIELLSDPALGTATVANNQILVRSAAPTAEGMIRVRYTVVDAGNLSDVGDLTVDVFDNRANRAPVAANDRATAVVGTPVDIPVLDNDDDPDGDPLSLLSVTAPEFGEVGIVDGILVYTPPETFPEADPAADASISVNVRYEIADNHGGNASGSVEILVKPKPEGNRPPDAVDDQVFVSVGQSRQHDLTSNDIDPDGGALRIVELAAIEGIEVTQIDDHVVDVRVTNDSLEGIFSVSYAVADPEGLRDTARLDIHVERLQQNRPPTAFDDPYVYQAGEIFDPTRNDVDPDGDPLSIIQADMEPRSLGTVTRVGTNGLRLNLSAGARGTVSVAYTISDPGGRTDVATVFVTIPPQAAPPAGPIARDDNFTVQAGSINTVLRILDNDTHPDGLAFSLAGSPTYTGGTVTANPNSTLSFTPRSTDPVGTVYSLTYTVRDGNGATDSAAVTVTVVAAPDVNVQPVAVDDTRSVDAGRIIVIDVLENDDDLDDDPLVIDSVSDVLPVGAGEVDVTAGKVRFVSSGEFAGIARFTYVIKDPSDAKSTATVYVQVLKQRNDPPIARDDFASMIIGESRELDVLGNDIDPDGASSALRLLSISDDSPLVDAGVLSNGRLSVRAILAGTAQLAYVIEDAQGNRATGHAQIQVQRPPDSPPVANDDKTDVQAGQTVTIRPLENDRDAEGGKLVITDVTAPGVRVDDSTISYTAGLNDAGVVALTYTIRDDAGNSDTATIEVTVLACTARVPVLTDDQAATRVGAPVEINLLGNDAVSEGTLSVSQPIEGTGTVASGADRGVITYSPPPTFSGIATFTYSIANICGARATANVRVTVNRRPVATPDVASSRGRGAVVVNVVLNDTDPDLDPLALSAVPYAGPGTVTFTASSIEFVPPPRPAGVYVIPYTIADPGGLTDSSTLTITVGDRVNEAPIAIPDEFSVNAGGSNAVNLLQNDSDPENDPLSVEIGAANPPGLGAPTLDGGVLTFVANSDADGIVVIPYSINDGQGHIVTSTVTITIVPPANSAPIALPDVDVATVGVPRELTVLANDNDPDGDVITITSAFVSDETIGTVAVSGAGTLLFTPLAEGTVTITYTIEDPKGQTDTTTVTVTVNP